MPTVAITQDLNDIGRAIDEALGYLTLEPLVRGKRVAVKPNETWATREDTTAVTQPDTLRAVLRQLARWQPAELIVSGGAGAISTDEVFEIAGLMAIVRDEGARYIDHNRGPFTDVPLSYGQSPEVQGPQRSVMVCRHVLDYDTLIAVNQLKLHETATVTLALKNVAMSFPAADHYGYPRKSERHANHFFDDMHSFIAAMIKRFPIHLAVTVGHPAMVGTGPIGGHTAETGLVIASTDALAADAVGARLLGFTVQGVRHLWEAAQLGLGESDFTRMSFPALNLQEGIERFTEAVYGRGLTSSTARH